MTQPANPTEISAADRALAAWESATVQNISPILDPDTTVAVWDAILAHRSTRDASAFAETARKAAEHADQRVRDAIEDAIRSLTALSASTQE